mgnify:CR=1 FL=1
MLNEELCLLQESSACALLSWWRQKEHTAPGREENNATVGLLQKFLAGTAYAIRSTFLAAQGAAPAQMVFGRDMALPAGFSIDWDEITRRKQKRINESCERENRRRIDHTYQKGDKVLMKVPKKILRKLEKPRRGPFTVIEHHDNGTVTIQKSPCVTDNINIRRLDPFFE